MKLRSFAIALIVAALALSGTVALHNGTGGAEQAESAEISTAGAPASQSGGKTVRVAQNGRLALDFDPATAEIAVTDLSSNTVWRSNPADRAEDKIAKGAKKMDLQSQLLLDYVDPLSKPFQINNYTGSVKDGSFTWNKVHNGIEVTFEFKDTGFFIPVLYTLGNESFSAAIQTDRIEQKDKFSLVNISLLPFFGSGSLEDQGYLLVPDGSGAIIRFNNNKSFHKSYNERVFGSDQALDISEKSSVKEDIKLPVFGLKKNGHAFVAIIHQGAYQAGITAEVSWKNNQYNSVYSYLNMMEFESNLLLPGTANEKLVVRGSKSLAGKQPYEVRYYFLNGDQADYTGMANSYRTYLTAEKGIKPTQPTKPGQIPLHLNFLGGVKKRDTFLGIPYNTVEVLTSYQDLKNAAERLVAGGIDNLSIRYEGWMSGGMKDEVPTSLSSERKLGGGKGFQALRDYMDEQGISFYPSVDPVHYFEGGNGFHKFFDVAKGISRAPAIKSEFLLSNGTKNKDISPWYLLKPESVKEALERFSASAEEDGLKKVALLSIGDTVYSDFRRNSLSKNSTGLLWEEGLSLASGKLDGLMFDHASAYTFPYAESLTDVPLFSSSFDIEDETVPFYSIAVSGLIPAFSEPVNLSSAPHQYLLKLIETGTYPAYRFISRDGSLLVGTEFDSLYSGDLNVWYDEMASQYKQINSALEQVKGQAIVGHEKISNGIYRTTFANGITAVVNYTDDAVTVDSSRIEANNYLIR